jgi:hypothetical protein
VARFLLYGHPLDIIHAATEALAAELLRSQFAKQAYRLAV